ncbi:MAG: GXGXG motif-containing protein, partial [Thaumarchaeota archaeon]|nr:GXGXG motif-containing protein [Nitrososphaerota archaeon]
KSLGADAKIEPVNRKEQKEVVHILENAGARPEDIPRSFKKIVSKKKLYHYDSLEPLERDRMVI